MERGPGVPQPQGVANLTAACAGGFPCGGSFSRSSINRLSGARTRLAGGVTGLTVLAFLPVAWILEPLPLAVLGAIVISAVLGLMRFRPLLRLWRYSAPQAVIAWGTFLATLLLTPRLDWAVLVGIGLSIAVFLGRSLQLAIDVTEADGLLRLTPRGVLWFATAHRLDDALLTALAEHPDVDRLTIELSRLGRIDTSGALELRAVLDQARAAGLTADVVDIPPQSRRLTERIMAPTEDPLS